MGRAHYVITVRHWLFTGFVDKDRKISSHVIDEIVVEYVEATRCMLNLVIEISSLKSKWGDRIFRKPKTPDQFPYIREAAYSDLAYYPVAVQIIVALP